MQVNIPNMPVLSVKDYMVAFAFEDNRSFCVIIKSGVQITKGYSTCSPKDIFDPIFGMKKAMERALESLPREDRRPFYQTFFSAYGTGQCLQKGNEQLKFVFVISHKA